MIAAAENNVLALDLLSTSQKTPVRCGYGAPLIAVIKDGQGSIRQACCNHWDCPRCRWTLAAYHRHRMIEGAKLLLERGPLYFWTLTCRGKELDLETADSDYYLWTNRLLSTCRASARKNGIDWAYVQVTERQKRGAAHSHLLNTFCPPDTTRKTDNNGRVHCFSDWFVRANVRAGLGHQTTITEVTSSIGAASYISGYLEKQISLDAWPPKWKRIRYSKGFPDTTERPDWARALMGREDWRETDKQKCSFVAQDDLTYELARHHMFKVVKPL